MRKQIAARVIVTFLVGLSLAKQALSQPGYGVSTTEVDPPAHQSPLPASGAGANNSIAVPSSKAEDTQLSSPSATAAQVEQLAAVEQSPALNSPSARLASSVNVCVEHYLRAIDPNKRDWNPSDPRWNTMRAVVSQGCAAVADGYKEKVAPVFRKAYFDAIRKSYEKHLSSTEADTLIRFYESDVGKRYLAFQGQLIASGGQGMGQLFGGKAGTDSQVSAPETMKARMQLLRLSRTFSMLIAATEDARNGGGDASGAPAIAIMMHVTAEGQGETLDRIGREYSADLPEFTAFAESPAETKELRALFEATDAAGKATAAVALEISPDMNGNLNKWRDLYHSLPRDQ